MTVLFQDGRPEGTLSQILASCGVAPRDAWQYRARTRPDGAFVVDGPDYIEVRVRCDAVPCENADCSLFEHDEDDAVDGRAAPGVG